MASGCARDLACSVCFPVNRAWRSKPLLLPSIDSRLEIFEPVGWRWRLKIAGINKFRASWTQNI
jgi:hypothetical protein